MPTSTSRRWTPAEVARLKRLASDHTAQELGALFERTPAAIRTKAAHLRLVLREKAGTADDASSAADTSEPNE